MDKVQYLSYVRELPTPEKRNAELALFFRQPQQAEATYLQAGLIFRAIQLNMSLFLWERSEVIPSKHLMLPFVVIVVVYLLLFVCYSGRWSWQ